MNISMVATSLNYFGNLKWRICSEIMITGIICGNEFYNPQVRGFKSLRSNAVVA